MWFSFKILSFLILYVENMYIICMTTILCQVCFCVVFQGSAFLECFIKQCVIVNKLVPPIQCYIFYFSLVILLNHELSPFLRIIQVDLYSGNGLYYNYWKCITAGSLYHAHIQTKSILINIFQSNCHSSLKT